MPDEYLEDYTRSHAFRFLKPTEDVEEIYNSNNGQQRVLPRPNVQVNQPPHRPNVQVNQPPHRPNVQVNQPPHHPSNPPQARPPTGYNSRRQKFQNKKLHG